MWDEGHALVVRCDTCRRLWPISAVREREIDADEDLHRCPICARATRTRDGRRPSSMIAKR